MVLLARTASAAFRWALGDPFPGVPGQGGEALLPVVPSASQPAAGASRWAPVAEPSVAVPGTRAAMRGTVRLGAAI